MKRKILLTFGALAASGLFLNAQVSWDGDTDNVWDTDANWTTDTAPTASTDAVFDVSTGLPGFGGVAVTAGAVQDLTVDIGAWAVRSNGGGAAKTLDFESITFTSNFDNNGGVGQTFTDGGGTSALFRLRIAAVNSTMTNNGTNPVVFSVGTAQNEFGITDTGSGTNLLLGGSGGFQWDGGIVFAGVARFGTSSGTLDINGGVFNMGNDLRAEGGTINVNASDVIGDGVGITLNDNAGAIDATIDFSGQTEVAGLLASFNNGGFLGVDASTDLSLTNFNDNAVIDITGWLEGSSSIVFTALGGAVYSGTVADGAAFNNLTIGGSTAYMDDIGGGSWAVTAVVPEPSTYALLAGALSLLCVMIRRRS